MHNGSLTNTTQHPNNEKECVQCLSMFPIRNPRSHLLRCQSCRDNAKCVDCGRPVKTGMRCGMCRERHRGSPCLGKCGKTVVWGCVSGFCMSCVRLGEKSPGWKGGRNITSDGYVRVYIHDLLNPGLSKSSTVGGYILEHRLVMEQRLGRYLHSNENVHHKNGQRDDNHSDNLELWIIQQPPGQRVDDVVNWCKQMLRLYEPEALTKTKRGK